MNFQINFNENANLKLKLYTEGQITLFFGHNLTVMFPSTKIRYPSKIWDSAKKLGSNRKLDLSRPEVEKRPGTFLLSNLTFGKLFVT